MEESRLLHKTVSVYADGVLLKRLMDVVWDFNKVSLTFIKLDNKQPDFSKKQIKITCELEDMTVHVLFDELCTHINTTTAASVDSEFITETVYYSVVNE